MRLVQQVRQLTSFLTAVQVPPVWVIVAAVFSFFASLFEGVSLGLLPPVIRGVVTMDFNFVWEQPYLAGVLEYLPHRWVASEMSLFIVLVGVIFVGTLAKTVLRYASSMSMAHVARLALHGLRQRVFARYMSFGKLFFDRHSAGYLNAVLVDYTTRVAKPLLEGHLLLNSVFSGLMYVVVMLFISWKLTLFLLVLFPLLNFTQQTLLTRIGTASHHMTEVLNRFSKRIYNTLSAIPLVMAYNQEQHEERRFAAVSREVADVEFRIANLHNLGRPIQELIALSTILLLVIGMMSLLARGIGGEAASFLVYFYIVTHITGSYAMIQRFQGFLAHAEGPLAEVKHMFSDDSKFFVLNGKTMFAGLHRSIEFRSLSFSFSGERPILRDISLVIPRGSMMAVVGPSGAGKTTLINLLMRYYDCSPGALFIDDTDIREFDLYSLRTHMALVSQYTELFHDTLRRNIIYGLGTVSEEQLLVALTRARLSDFVASLPAGLETEIGDRGVKLSGGERQRVAVARALLKGADILILDEATSSLDSTTERLIQEAINEAVVGKTAIVIAHRLSTIQHADQIAVIDGGWLVEQGSLVELLKRRGRFYQLWEAQRFV